MTTHNPLPNRILLSVVVVLALTLACSSTPVEVVVPTSTPILQPTSTPAPVEKPVPSASDLSLATVQIWAVLEGEYIWSGSGTIISSDGLILTNAHVADNQAPGLTTLYGPNPSPSPDELRIALVKSPDEPPVETYLAKLANSDGIIDVALVRIVSDLDGNPVEASALDLPFVELGDSDSVQLGDSVRIFGFPGVGGETITFTQGTVSGFESQDPVGDRVWIKTDSDISPGNSGGLAVNEAGQIIGIPTRIRGDEGSDILGRLSSINNAKPLIEAALSGARYTPYVAGGTGNEQFTLSTWSMDFDDNGCAVEPVETYPSGALAVVSVWDYSGMTDTEEILVTHTYNGELVGFYPYLWELGASGGCNYELLQNAGRPIPDGNYQVQVYAGREFKLIGSADTAIGPIQTGDIKVTGQIYDYVTNKGIADALFFVLKPGVSTQSWYDNDFPEADVYTYAVTDSRGNFTLPAKLERLITYPIVLAAEAYYDGWWDLRFGQTDPVQINLTLSLEPR